MFARQPWKEIASRIILVAVILFNAFIPVSAKASAIMETESAGKEDISNGLTLGASKSAFQANVPILSEEIAKQAAQQEDEKPVEFKVWAEPAIYQPGKPIRLNWKVKNVSASDMDNAQVVIHPPEGLTPADADVVYTQDGLVTVALKKDTSTWNVADGAEVPIFFGIDLLVNDDLIESATVMVDRAKFSVEKGKGGKLNGLGGKVEVEVPVEAIDESLDFDIREPASQSQPGVSLTWNPIEIIAVGKNSQKNVSHFKSPIRIKVKYDETKIFDWDEKALTLYYYDPDAFDWFPMETTVDAQNNTLTVLSDHLTVFDYKANSWQSQMVPTVDAFKVSDFTGAGTYQVNLWTPPGPGGLQPSLTLSYNSQIIDESSAFSQGSWVGMGWTLDTGSITRNMHGTATDNGQMDDDTFSISVGGISGQLLPVGRDSTGEVTTYNTADQSFAKVVGDNISYKFTAWTKDGTKYEFAKATSVDLSLGCSTTATPTTWRWSLTSVTDVHGNTITYTYDNELKPPNCVNEIAVYPKKITYGNGYSIIFVPGNRNDYQLSWTYAASHTLYGTKRLNQIKIQQNGVTIRRYDLTYALDTSTTNIIFPNFTWSRETGITARTLTLVGIQEFARDDFLNDPSPSLPAVTFTYADKMHLTQVDNGQGGTVTMSYQKWSYYDDVNHDLRSLKTNFGVNECSTTLGTQWARITGNTGTVRCDPGDGSATGGLLQVGNSSNTLSIAERAMPENLVKPGGRYNLWFDVFAISGTTSVSWGISYNTLKTMDSQTGITTTGGGVQKQLNMPATYNPSKTKFRIECGKCFFRDLEYQFMPELYRVTERTVTVQPTNASSTYKYYYDNAAPNSKDNSAAANVTNGTLYTPILRENRGNAMTQSVNPEGLATVNWYWQSDDLKGRAYDTLVMKQVGKYYNFETATDPAINPGCEVSNVDWLKSTGGTLSFGYMNQGVDFDCSASLLNSTTSFESYSKKQSLTPGEVAVAHVRLVGTNAQGEVGLVDNNGQFVGITLQSSTAITSDGQVLLTNFTKSKWYGVMFFADSVNRTRVRIWQLDNPLNFAEKVVGSTGASSWTFRERVKSGTIWLDSYFEGVPYTETLTRYATATHYSVTTVNNLIYSPTVFQDLKVVFNSVDSVEQRNYNGDTKYVATKQVFTYDTAPTGYGNLLNQQEYTYDYDYDNGNGKWNLYRGSKVQYAAPVNTTTAYIVGLPGRLVTLDCIDLTSCNFDSESGKVSETISYYDNNSSFTATPVKGLLTKQRVWVQDNDYSQTDIEYDSHDNPHIQTVYTGYATQTTNPSSGAEKTYTCYGTGETLNGQACLDDGYHTYPRWVRNALGQTTWTTYNALGLPDSVTDANNVTTYASYDGFGRMTKIAAPDDSLATPTLAITYYDGRSPFQIDLTQKVSDTASIRLSRFYDGAGRQIQTQTVGAVVDGVQKNIVVDSLYDSLGRLSQQSVPNVAAFDETPDFVAQNFNQFTLIKYDGLGRTSFVTKPNTNQIQYTYGDLTTTMKDPNGYTTTTTADEWGRTVSVAAPTGPGVSYEYDVLGRLLSAARGGATTSVTYDSAGRKVSMIDPDMGSWTYGYDALGNLKVQKDARNQYICLYYDALNRLSGKHYRSDNACPVSPVYDVTYLYDDTTNGNMGIGRRTGMSMTDASNPSSWVYDTRGRMTQETKVIDDQSFETSWTYNSADLPVTMTYPGSGSDREMLTYGYNSDGTLNTVTSSLGGATYLGGMKYDEAGRIKSMDYGASIIRKTYTYFDWSELVQGGLLNSAVTTRLSDQTTIQNFAYTYDKNANVQSITDALTGPQTQTFGYDALNRLTSAQVTGGTDGLYNESYSYDTGTGNLSVKAGVGYTYDPNHPHAVLSLTNDNRYSYDANGNMISRHVEAQDYLLNYDEENRLTSVSTDTLGMNIPSGIRMQGGGEHPLYAPVAQPLQQSGFPSTPVLDTFNRAGGLGASWDGDISGYTISSNQVNVGTGDNDIYWQGASSYGADQEAYVTLVNVNESGVEQDLLLKSQSASDSSGGVLEVLYNATSQQVQVWTYDPIATPNQWQQRCTISIQFADGDQFGARARANGDVEVYKNGALQGSICNVSAWRFYNATGYIGLWFINAGGAVLDDFGGGTVSTGATNTPTATATATNTPISSPTATDTATATNSPVATNTFTDTPTATSTFTPTATETFTPTATFTPSLTPSTPTTPPPGIFSNATFTYDGDGKRVKSVLTTNIATTTTYFAGAYYEVANGVVTKYYYAGAQRIAMRANGDLKFLLGDHLGSTSLVTDANGQNAIETRYTAWGEVRYATPNSTLPTKYTFTGQYSYQSDFGLMFYNARWVDVSLGRFAQADSIVPGGVQGLDRYAYTDNNPVKYLDPSGHCTVDSDDDTCHGNKKADLPLIIFETDPGKSWTQEEIEVINDGAKDVGRAFAREMNRELRFLYKTGEISTYNPITPTQAFLMVYGGSVTVIRKNFDCGKDKCWGRSISANEIWIYSNATTKNIIEHPNLIVHELAHSFDTAMRKGGIGIPYEGMKGVTSRSGFYGPPYFWQLSTDYKSSEIYADMFLGWVYGKWEVGDNGTLTTAASTKQHSMDITGSQIISLVGYYNLLQAAEVP